MEPENPPTPFELLDRGIQEALWRMRWTSLRPIQAEAIEEILGRDRHVIIREVRWWRGLKPREERT